MQPKHQIFQANRVPGAKTELITILLIRHANIPIWNKFLIDYCIKQIHFFIKLKNKTLIKYSNASREILPSSKKLENKLLLEKIKINIMKNRQYYTYIVFEMTLLWIKKNISIYVKIQYDL